MATWTLSPRWPSRWQCSALHRRRCKTGAPPGAATLAPTARLPAEKDPCLLYSRVGPVDRPQAASRRSSHPRAQLSEALKTGLNAA